MREHKERTAVDLCVSMIESSVSLFSMVSCLSPGRGSSLVAISTNQVEEDLPWGEPWHEFGTFVGVGKTEEKNNARTCIY